MSVNKRSGIILSVFGLGCIILALFILQFGTVLAYHEGPPFPTDFAGQGWFHLGSKSITPEAAAALGLPADVFGDTFDAVFANGIAMNDLRSGTLPFRDGAEFVVPFYRLEHPIDGLDATGGLAFVAVMLKDSQHFDESYGWGFEAFTPDGTRLTDLRPACIACHESQAANDYVFSTLAERTVSAVPAADNGVFLPTDYRQMNWLGAKVIRPDAATALGLPAEIFGNTFESVYANTTAQAALQSSERPFPVGSLFVADFHQAAFPADGLAAWGGEGFTAVMLKGMPGSGDDVATGDWKFEAFAADGTPLSDLRPACISCHTGVADNDYVFTGR
ncbi:MAG: cytochrome P460 family protein [Anaerolineae bacterium]|nr:cytochrome P460 family protein [Anaerolineae bacterium]